METNGLVRRDKLTYVQAPTLDRFPFLTHAFCTRQGGVSVGPYAGLNLAPLDGEDSKNVRNNWYILSRAFGIEPDRFFLLRQIHGDGILVLDGELPPDSFPEPPAYDALITDQPNLALCIKTADCVPILLVSPKKRVVAAIHAGWKGTARNLAGRVVSTLCERFGADPGDLLAVIGPAIGPCCYEVDDPVVSSLAVRRDDGAVCRPSVFRGRWMIDLPRINEGQLGQAGLNPSCISRMDFCTACLPDLFFSHRRDRGRTGRQVSFIMLLEGAAHPPQKRA